jgi:Ca2+-binding EF-hand superfamily protein
MNLVLSSFSKKELEELFEAYRSRYIEGEILKSDYTEFLAALGYNATQIKEEIEDADQHSI